MVNRTVDRHPDADHLLDNMVTWPDNPESAWYYAQIQEATNAHAYTMHTDQEDAPYENLDGAPPQPGLVCLGTGVVRCPRRRGKNATA